MTAYTNISFAGYRPVNCYGSLILCNNLNFNIGDSYLSGEIYFLGSIAGVINTYGKSLNCNFTFQGSGPWTLQSDLILNSYNYNSLNFIQGSLNTAGFNVNAYIFGTSGSTTNSKRNLNLGASKIYVQLWDFTDSTQLKIVPGTSTIYISFVFPTGSTFYGGSQSYNIVTGNAGADTYIYGSNTFNTLTLNNTKNIIFEKGTTQTFTTFNCPNGTDCAHFVSLVSATPGIPVTLKKTSGVFTVNYMIITDVKATGGATFTANNSIGTGDVAGWTFSAYTGKRYYWIGGTGNWDQAAHWSNTSGGAAGTCLPSPADTVIFDVNSFSATNQTVTVNANACCKSMDWTGVKFNPAFTGFNILTINGSLTLVNNMNYSFRGTLQFTSDDTDNIIKTAGNTLYDIELDGSGVYTLSDSINVSSHFTFNRGTLITNNNKLQSNTFQSNSGEPRNLNLGSSLVSISKWMITDTNKFTFNAGMSKFFINGGTLNGGGLKYNEVTFKPSQYGNVDMIDNSNTFNVLTFLPGTSNYFESGKTQTVTTLNATGKASGMIYFQAYTPGQTATIKKVGGGDFCADYITVKDMTATDANFYCGANSINEGNSAGWTMTNLTANDQYKTVCGDIKGFANVDLTLMDNTINGGTAYPVTWFMDAGLTTPVATPTNTKVTNGQKLYAMVTSATCSNTATVYYTVQSFTANNQTLAVCEDALGSGKLSGVNLNNLKSAITGGGTATISWFSDAGLTIPIPKPDSVAVTNAAIFYVKVDNGLCNPVNATVTYSVNSLPTLDLGKDSTILTNQSLILNPGSFTSYLWSDASANPTLIVNGSVTGPGMFKYGVTVKNASGCANKDSVTITVDLPSSISLIASTKIKLYPNPCKGIMYLEFTGGSNDAVVIEIVNMNGQKVLVITIQQPKSGDLYKLDLSSFAKGIYMLRLNNSTVSQLLKVVIE